MHLLFLLILWLYAMERSQSCDLQSADNKQTRKIAIKDNYCILVQHFKYFCITYIVIDVFLQCIVIIRMHGVKMKQKIHIIPHVVIVQYMITKSLNVHREKEINGSVIVSYWKHTFPFLSKVSLSIPQIKQ